MKSPDRLLSRRAFVQHSAGLAASALLAGRARAAEPAAGFRHEGDELRAWFRENVPENFFVICGDRHWQYHSVHPETGLHEFSVGGASDAHAGGSPGEDPGYHRFHRIKGGFLSVDAEENRITFRHRDVHGAAQHEFVKARA